ncbi:hypothetical protein ACWC5I_14250 [Kitasatospora sp. NPDC001574]
MSSPTPPGAHSTQAPVPGQSSTQSAEVGAATLVSQSIGAATSPTQSDPRNLAREAALGKVLHWLFFGVLFAVLPILAGLLINVSRTGHYGFWSLAGKGDLYIVTAGLAAAATGQILTKKTARKTLLSNFLAFSNIFIACLASVMYANVSTGGGSLDEHAVGLYSLGFFAVTFITAGSSALVVELEEL